MIYEHKDVWFRLSVSHVTKTGRLPRRPSARRHHTKHDSGFFPRTCSLTNKQTNWTSTARRKWLKSGHTPRLKHTQWRKSHLTLDISTYWLQCHVTASAGTYRKRQQNVTIFRYLFRSIGLNIRNIKLRNIDSNMHFNVCFLFLKNYIS